MEKETKKHDSFGAISMSRITGDMDLFGSSVKTSSAIAIRINTAEEENSYGKPRHVKKEGVIEVYLSPNQFSELITTMNVSEGVPCTINWMSGKGSIEREKRTNRREVSESYLKEILGSLTAMLDNIREYAEDLNKKPSVSKKDRVKLSKDLDVLSNHLKSNIPFVETTFIEVMDKAVVEAKSDIDATITHLVTSLGIESLNQKRNILEE